MANDDSDEEMPSVDEAQNNFQKTCIIDARKMNARFSLRKTCYGRIAIKRKTRLNIVIIPQAASSLSYGNFLIYGNIIYKSE